MTKILIAYASAKGSTRGVAGRIAERCGAAGFDVTMFPAVESPGHEWFDAVILGSAIHDMDWLPSATVIVDRRRVAVKTQPVRAFSVATWGETSTFLSTQLTRRIRKSASEPRTVTKLRKSADLRDHRRFAGALTRGDWLLVGALSSRSWAVDTRLLETGPTSMRGRTRSRNNSVAVNSSTPHEPRMPHDSSMIDKGP
ncbi:MULTISPECIES: flavodoxin domain-containing protein [Rhodococcus]|uniref:flavodoxin domain-containing protein n=1 Tax=Rhodococcus TaxID=1827 RepID=UPI0009EDFBBA